MASVDDRVVQMEFDNKSFATGVTATMSLLDKLKASLSFGGTKNGLDDVQTSANRFSLSHVGDAVSGATNKFSALSIAGVTALATIASKAVDAGITFGKAFTIDPIKAGFANYETQINAVQTILANTGLKGAAGLAEVNKTLADLNTYANKTVYNFSQMAASIGTFTAAGIKLEPASAAIKGIANLAAASGASADQASGAMYQLSQALAAGTFKLQDYNSVVNAGIGGKLFQEAIFNAATAAHTLKGVKLGETYDQWTAAGNNFRSSLQQGYVTTKVLSNALASFTGDQTAAQLKAQGYNAAQILHIQQTARLAVDAATQIKTFSQLTSALKEEVATAYGAVFKTIFGDINGATALFSKLHTSVENALTNPIYQFNALLQAASALGARTNVIQAFTNIIHALGSVLKPIVAAFHEIFPPETAANINRITLEFLSLSKSLIPSAKTVDEIKRTFAGLFAIFDLGRQVAGDLLRGLAPVFDEFKGGPSAILSVTAGIGDFLVHMDNAVREGGKLEDFFNRLGEDLVVPIQLLKTVRDTITDLFNNFKAKDANSISDAFQNMGSKLGPLRVELGKIADIFSNTFGPLAQELKPALDGIVALFGSLGTNIATALQNQDFTGVNKILQTGLLAGIFLTIKKFFAKGFNIKLGGGLIGTIKESFETLTGTLKTMQLELKAKALEEIAIAIGILTASVVALSFVNPTNLKKSLQTMAVGFGELLAAFGIMIKATNGAGIAKMPIAAASLVILSGAILTLTASVAILGTMNWDTLQKGLTAVSILLAVVSAAAIIISKNSGSMISAGIGITAIATAMVILAGAVALFGSMDLVTLGKGIGAVAAALLIIAGAMHLMPKGMALQAVGILALAVALQGIFLAVKSFSTLDYKTMARGLAGVAGSLAIIAGAMHLMPKGMALQAASLLLIAVAIGMLEKSVASFAGMSWEEIGRGIGALALALSALVGAVNLMDGAVLGAVALALVTSTLQNLVPVIQILSKMSWGSIAKGIGAFAIALGVLIGAGYLAEGAAVGLAALGLGALGLGIGLDLAGHGIQLIADGLSALAKAGPAGVAVLLKAIAGFISQVPAMATAFAQGFINILKIIGQNGPAIVTAFSTILGSLLLAITQNAPKFATAMTALITAFLKIVVDNAPQIIAAGLTLLEDLLTGIGDNIGKVTDEVAAIIINFLNALASHAGELVTAGLNVLVQFLQGISNNIGKVIGAATGVVTSFITGIANSTGKIVTAGANAVINVITGLGQNVGRIIDAGTNVIINFVTGLGKNAAKLADAAGKALLQFLDGIDDAINKYEAQIIVECAKIGVDIIRGILSGLGSLASQLFDYLKDQIGSAITDSISWATSLFGSPFKIGAILGQGLIEGVSSKASGLSDTMQSGVTDAIKDTIKAIDLTGVPDISVAPIITPVLDLTNVMKDASKIPGMLAPTPIVAQTSFTAASAISVNQQQAAADQAENGSSNGGTVIEKIELNQTNTSPKALSTLEIYRQSKNLLGQAKTTLGIPTP